jgi:hypothetical protein
MGRGDRRRGPRAELSGEWGRVGACMLSIEKRMDVDGTERQYRVV